MISALLFGVFVVLIFFGVPIAFSLMLASSAVVLAQGSSLILVAQRFFTSNDSFPFMAIPFFMLAGEIMTAGGASKRLVNLAGVFVGWITGGLAMVVTLTGMFFASLSGSSAATTAAIGGVLIPAMKEKGYDKEFTAAIVAAAGTTGIVIPPSITMVVFGVATQTSITKLFVGGILPGILMGVSMMGVTYFRAKKRNYAGEPSKGAKENIRIVRDGLWALFMPIIILGGIYGGVFTATESAVVAVVYGLFIGLFIYKELTLKKLPDVMIKSLTGSAVVMIIMNAAGLFGWILTADMIPQKIAYAIAAFTSNKYLIMILINIFLLFVGTFLNASAAVVILAPILLPILTTVGYDPVFVGVVMVVNMAIGCITPPVGVDLFVAQTISGVSIVRITKAILPLMGVLVIDLLLLIFFPQIVLFLPSFMG